jgi:hypothetical protein
MTMSSDPIIAALEDLVGCYRRLGKLAEVQHEYVEREQTEELLGLLSLRQEVLDRIGILEETIDPLKKDSSAYLDRLGSNGRVQAEKLLSETRRLLEEITTADRNDAMVLQQRKISLGRQIRAASAARQVNRTYATAAYGTRKARTDLQR